MFEDKVMQRQKNRFYRLETGNKDLEEEEEKKTTGHLSRLTNPAGGLRAEERSAARKIHCLISHRHAKPTDEQLFVRRSQRGDGQTPST